MSVVAEWLQQIWHQTPSAPAWWSVLNDAKNEYILHGAVIYVLMQPVLVKIFAKRERYTGEKKKRKKKKKKKIFILPFFLFSFSEHKFAWKALMTSYNVAMCVYSLVTAVVTINGLYVGGGILTGRMNSMRGNRPQGAC
jgi:hypothetical protein